MNTTKLLIVLLLLSVVPLCRPLEAAVNIWSSPISPNLISGDRGVKVVADSATSDVYAAGSVNDHDPNNPSDTDFVVAKYDGSGSLLWLRKLPNQGGGIDSAEYIALDSAGDVIVAGHTYDAIKDSNAKANVLRVMKYSPAGAQIWSFRSSSAFAVASLAIDQSDNVVVAGVSDYGAAAIKLESDGVKLWDHEFSNGSASAVGVDQDGDIYLAVNAVENGFSALVKLDTNGNALWIHKRGQDTLAALAIDSEGNIYVTGTAPTDGSFITYRAGDTFKFSPDGVLLWSEEVGYNDGPVTGTAICVDSSDNIYVSLYAPSKSRDIVKQYSSKFQGRVWTANISASQAATDIEADHSGNLFVVAGQVDELTAANGRVVWKYKSGTENYSSVSPFPAGGFYLTGDPFVVSQWSTEVTTISGFGGDGAGFTRNNGSTARGFLTNFPPVTNDVLDITTLEGAESTSIFYDKPQPYDRFTVQFTYTYQGTTEGPGDGFTFTIQNDPRGLTALGGGGGSLGYGSGNYSDITNSFAFEMDHYGAPAGTSLDIDGATGNSNRGYPGGGVYTPTNPVSLTSSDPIRITLTYDGATVSETLADTVTGATFSTSSALNLHTAIGSPTAYVGFTGGTGDYNCVEAISDFSYTGFAAP